MGLPRFHIEGHIYYITTNVYNQLPLFVKPAYIIPLFDSLNFYRYRYHFRILGFTIMPDHIHIIIWPQVGAPISDIMRDFKKFTARRIIRQAKVEGREDLIHAFEDAGRATNRSDNKVWQDSYWDKNIFTDKFLRQKLNYVHRNPLRSGLVSEPELYPYSSYRNYSLNDDSLIEIDRGWTQT